MVAAGLVSACWLQPALAGPRPSRASDPNAMPLADYIAQVVRILDAPVEGKSVITDTADSLKRKGYIPPNPK